MGSIFFPEPMALSAQLVNTINRGSASIVVSHQLPCLLLPRPARRLDTTLRSFQSTDCVVGFRGYSSPVANGTMTTNSVPVFNPNHEVISFVC